MLYVKSYQEFNESLDVSEDLVLRSMGAVSCSLMNEFKLSRDIFSEGMDMDILVNNIDFINSLSSIGLKKSLVEYSDDYECFISKSCKFMFIYNSYSNELEDPVYIIIQLWDNLNKSWGSSKLYKIGGSVSNFYDKMSSRLIEIIDGAVKYIYSTSNGNEWVMQNREHIDDEWLGVMRSSELSKLVKDKGLDIIF